MWTHPYRTRDGSRGCVSRNLNAARTWEEQKMMGGIRIMIARGTAPSPHLPYLPSPTYLPYPSYLPYPTYLPYLPTLLTYVGRDRRGWGAGSR